MNTTFNLQLPEAFSTSQNMPLRFAENLDPNPIIKVIDGVTKCGMIYMCTKYALNLTYHRLFNQISGSLADKVLKKPNGE